MNMVFAIAFFSLAINRDYENISCNSGDKYFYRISNWGRVAKAGRTGTSKIG
jgi:hypothetical protein